MTGGRAATTAVDPGRYALSVGCPDIPSPVGWRWTSLTDVARLESGHTPSRKHPEYWDGDVPWIGIKDATQNDGHRLNDTLQTTTQLGIENSSARVLPTDTVCLSRTASVGYVVVMGRPMATSQDFVNWVCDPERLDWRFLGWTLLSERQSLRRWAHGTTHQTIYFPEVKAFHIKLPSVAEQHAIASVLGALDDKIASNRRAVDAAREALIYTRATLQDGSIVPLTSTATFRNGGALTKLATGEGVPILRIKELRSGVSHDTPRTDVGVRREHHVGFGDLLFSWSGTLLTCRWHGEPAVLNQHVFRVDPSNGYPPWLVEAWLEQHLPAFRQIAADKTTTMGHIQRHHLDDAMVNVPNADALAELSSKWTPVDQLRMGLLTEVRSLTAIRDALLPRLVSGRIRVPISEDVEEQVGVAVEALV